MSSVSAASADSISPSHQPQRPPVSPTNLLRSVRGPGSCVIRCESRFCLPWQRGRRCARRATLGIATGLQGDGASAPQAPPIAIGGAPCLANMQLSRTLRDVRAHSHTFDTVLQYVQYHRQVQPLPERGPRLCVPPRVPTLYSIVYAPTPSIRHSGAASAITKLHASRLPRSGRRSL